MKTIFDDATRQQVIGRIHSLDDNSQAQWGKMNVYQMVQHCEATEEQFLGKKLYDRTMLGRILGKIAIRSMLKDEKPMQRNAPTHPTLKNFNPECDLSAEKKKWAALVDEYKDYSPDVFVHWFFGKMSKEQLGQFAYKHIDHHLRQFGA